MLAFVKRSLALVAMSLVAIAAHAFEAGKDYDVLPNPVAVMADGKIHVEEAFWYGCPHCFSLESIIVPWKKTLPSDVVFEQIPAMFGKAWVSHAQLFYTLDVLGKLESSQSAIFTAIHRNKERLLGQGAQKDFLVDAGLVEGKAFDKAYNSFAVKTRMKQADKRVRSFKITGVPAVIVQGKYVVTAATAGGQQNMTKVIDHLIELERAALK